jgi:DDE family transposase
MGFAQDPSRARGFTLTVQRTSGGGRFVVSTDGRGLESHSGTGLLRLAADRFGLTAALRRALDGVRSWESHPPGVVVRDLAIVLADGGKAISDIETLRRREEALFDRVASEPTAWRTLEAIAADELAVHRLFDALAATRRRLWGLGAAPPGWDDPAVVAYVDLDATLVTAHSDKEQAAGNYKGGYGFQPILAFLDRGDGRGEPLGMLLRAGNAGANSVEDNADVLEQALMWLPGRPAGKPLVVRGDSAMATKGFVAYARSAGVKVSLSLPMGNHPKVQAAVRAVHDDPSPWTPAVRQDGSVREGAEVAELADVPLGEDWPEGLRIIIRREPLHPGAQQTFDDLDGQRFTALLTDLEDDDIVALDACHRARAHIEDRIKDAKDTGLANLPCGDFARNGVWGALVMVALTLVCWAQTLLLDGELALARPPTLRYRLWHVAARIARHGRRILVRLDANWPWATAVWRAFQRLWALPVPAG